MKHRTLSIVLPAVALAAAIGTGFAAQRHRQAATAEATRQAASQQETMRLRAWMQSVGFGSGPVVLPCGHPVTGGVSRGGFTVRWCAEGHSYQPTPGGWIRSD